MVEMPSKKEWSKRELSSSITKDDEGKEVIVGGWIHDIRNLGGISFTLLRDRSGLVQITTLKKNKAVFDLITTLPRESVIMVKGKVKSNEAVKRGFEIIPEEVEVLSEAKTPLPLGVADKVGADMDTRLNNRFLDLRKEKVKAIFELRDILIRGIRDFLEKNNFIEVHTPKIVAAGAEGGATLFPITYFDKKAYLAQSPQLYKQTLMAGGFDRIYELAPAYRAELSDTTRHISEFASLDVEIAFINSSEEIMKNIEELIYHSMKYLKNNGKEQLDRMDIVLNIPKVPFMRISYKECIELLKKHKEVEWGADIDTEAEKLIGKIVEEEYHKEFYFITDFPTVLKKSTFYAMRDDEDPKITTYFDLDCKGQELVSGGQREHRYDVLIKQMKENNLNLKSFEFYLKAFRYGMPPHGGYGLGIERYLQKILDLPNIRECVLFPRDRSRLVP